MDPYVGLLLYIFGLKEGEEVKREISENGEILSLEKAVKEALGTLPLVRGQKDPEPWGRYQKVLDLRFGLSGEKYSLQGAGRKRELSVCRERIRQLQAKAIGLLQHPSRSRGLRKFLAD